MILIRRRQLRRYDGHSDVVRDGRPSVRGTCKWFCVVEVMTIISYGAIVQNSLIPQ